MFDLSFGKLAILFSLCLIVLGPEKLPKLAQQLGRWTGQARAMARHFRAQLEQELAAEELLKQKREIEQKLTEPLKSTGEALQSAATEMTSATDTASAVVNSILRPSDDEYSHAHHGSQPMAHHDTDHEVTQSAVQETPVNSDPVVSDNTSNHTAVAAPTATAPTQAPPAPSAQ